VPALLTSDGVRLHAEVLPGGPDWVVLAHGFSGRTAVPALRRVATRLQAAATVLLYDARGHGRSAGRSTLGDREVLDVDAAVRAAREQGARRVATVGFSMGAGAVLRHAAQVEGYGLTERPDAVVVVSGTSSWSTRATATTPMRRLHLLVETRPGRLVTRTVLRTRVDPRGWRVPPVPPLDCVDRVGVPVLVVHGDRDSYLGLEHGRALARHPGVELWVEPGFGHAEAGMTDELSDRIGRHVTRVLAAAAAPAVVESGGTR